MNIDLSLGKKMLSTALDSRTEPRHRWYWVKEGFSPSLVRTAIETEQCSSSDLVVDPFCGSGTVPLEAARCQVRSAGAEVNPFLAFAAHTKTLTPRVGSIKQWHSIAQDAIFCEALSPLIGFSTFGNSSRKRGLFNLELLNGHHSAVQSLSSAPEMIASVLRLCMLRAMLDCANFVRDGKALRYNETRIQRRFGCDELANSFSSYVSDAIYDIEHDQPLVHIPTIDLTDSRKLLPVSFKGFKVCVMSPPYLNSFDYTDVYRPELFLGGFIESASELRELRYHTVRSHVQALWSPPVEVDFGTEFSECLDAIKSNRDQLWNQRIPTMIQAYFEDLRMVLRNLRLMAGVNASVWMVVSTSAYAGVEVPVDRILSNVGIQVGWRLREVHVLRHLRSSGQQLSKLSGRAQNAMMPLRESLIILDS